MSVLLTACKKSKMLANKSKARRNKLDRPVEEGEDGGAAAPSENGLGGEEAKEWKFYLEDEFFYLIFYPSHGEIYLNGAMVTPVQTDRHFDFCIGSSKARITVESADAIILSIDGESSA